MTNLFLKKIMRYFIIIFYKFKLYSKIIWIQKIVLKKLLKLNTYRKKIYVLLPYYNNIFFLTVIPTTGLEPVRLTAQILSLLCIPFHQVGTLNDINLIILLQIGRFVRK